VLQRPEESPASRKPLPLAGCPLKKEWLVP
jgi:hypothetical protein